MALDQTTQDIIKDLEKRLGEAEKSLEEMNAWKTSKEVQQLQYPLDFVSQQIIQGFVQVGGASYLPLGGTPGFGIYYATGNPNSNNVFAAQGSLYMRYDGLNDATRAYINTDGLDSWTPVVTLA